MYSEYRHGSFSSLAAYFNGADYARWPERSIDHELSQMLKVRGATV
jgi:hypothetical protein